MSTLSMTSQVKKHGWPLHVVFTENDDQTRADVVLDVVGHHYHGWGWARRNPTDPAVPRIGEEIAAARALKRLARQLLDTAAEEIDDLEGHRSGSTSEAIEADDGDARRAAYSAGLEEGPQAVSRGGMA